MLQLHICHQEKLNSSSNVIKLPAQYYLNIINNNSASTRRAERSGKQRQDQSPSAPPKITGHLQRHMHQISASPKSGTLCIVGQALLDM